MERIKFKGGFTKEMMLDLSFVNEFVFLAEGDTSKEKEA